MANDRVLCLFHDDTIKGMKINSLTYSKLFDIDSSITKLTSLLSLGLQDGYYILDLKDNSEVYLNALISEINASDFPAQQLSFQSPDIEALNIIRKAVPSANFIFLSKLKRELPWFKKPSTSGIIDKLVRNKINIVSFKGRKFLDEDFVTNFKINEIKVLVWNINETHRVEHYMDIGVDGIITDRLLEIQQYIASISDL